MEEEIVKLLHLTYSGNSQEIQNAADVLFQNMAQPNFFPSLFSIIFNQQIEISARVSAVVFLNNIISYHWNKENINAPIKQLIINFLPQFLMNNQQELSSVAVKLAKGLVKQAFFSNEWPQFLELIFSGFQNDQSHIHCSLILSNSLCALVKKENIDLILNFSTNIFPCFSNILHSSQNIEADIQLICVCYHCASRLLSFKECFDIAQITPNIQHMIKSSLMVKEISSENPFFEQLTKKILKFLTNCVSLIDFDFISMFMNILQQMIASPLSNSIKCNALQLINNIFTKTNFFSSRNEQELVNNLVLILFPLFSVSNEDIETAQKDPSLFISENHKICDDFNDPKAAASYILYNVSKRYNILVTTCMSSIMNAYQLFSNGQSSWPNLFSIFHMCSSVMNLAAKQSNDGVIALFHSISPLFQNDSDLFATASALMLLSSAQNLKYSKELIKVVFSHIDSPFRLNQLYAIECISVVLRHISKNQILKDQIFAEYGNKLEQSLQILLSASSDGQNASLTESFNYYFSVFGSKLLPFSQDFAKHFLNIIDEVSNCGVNPDSFSTLIMAIESLSSLLNIVMKSEEVAVQLCPAIYSTLLHLLPKIPHTIMESYFSLFNQIVIGSPFNPMYWDIISVFNAELIDFFSRQFEFLQFRDINMTNNSDAVQFMINFINTSVNQVNDCDSLLIYIPAINGFILRMTHLVANDINFIQMILSKLIPTIQVFCENPDEFVPSEFLKLLSSLLIVNTSGVAQICGDFFFAVLNFWHRNIIYPYSIAAFATIFPILSDEQKVDILPTVLNLLYQKMLNKSSIENNNDDDFDDDDEIEMSSENCPWFDDAMILSTILKIINENQGSNIFIKCDPSQIAAIIQSCNECSGCST